MLYGWKFQAGSESVDYNDVLTFSFSVPNVGWVKENFLGAIRGLTLTANWTPQEYEAERVGCFILGSLRINEMLALCVPFVTNDIPSNLLLCDGSQYERVAYPQLFSVLHSSLIVDADHFVTPDMRSRFMVGAGQGAGLSSYAIGDTGGKETHALSVDELPAHHHQYSKETYNIDVESVGVPDPTGVGLPGLSTDTSDTGSNAAHENRPPYYAVRWGMVCR